MKLPRFSLTEILILIKIIAMIIVVILCLKLLIPRLISWYSAQSTSTSSDVPSHYAVMVSGETKTIILEPERKLSNLTWKDTNLWILTRKMRDDEAPEEYEFKESTALGLIEDTVVIKETK